MLSVLSVVNTARAGSGFVRTFLRRAVAIAIFTNALTSAEPARADGASCQQGISRETTERLFAVLNHPPAESDCSFQGVRTTGSVLEARWQRGGNVLPPIRVRPRECASGAGEEAGPFLIDVPAEIAQNCPSVVPLVAEFVRQVPNETPAGRLGSARDPLFLAARALFLAIFAIAAALLIRGAAYARAVDRRWVALGVAGFAAALALRAALPFSLGNWYAEVMGAAGPPPWMRFGPGYFAFQSLLRDAGLWSSHTLALTQIIIGAAAVPLMVAVVRELRVDLPAAAAAVVLLVVAPFHARLSATTSEHVLASTLCLWLLLAWLRAFSAGDWLWFAVAVLLFPAVCATRVDMAVQASLALMWPFLRDPAERAHDVRRRPRAAMVAILCVVAISTLAAAYWLIAIPSQHPMPEWSWHVFALRHFVPQFWLLAVNEPGWISLPAVLLALVGLPAMAIQRPWLAVRVVGTLLIAFVAAGRTFMHDELLGARYFLFTIPIFLVMSGYGFEALLKAVPARLRTAAAAIGIVGLALWAGLGARSAYAARYAFEDEYMFARRALAQLPDGCAVYQVAVRDDALPHDVDCCLDLPRSPLTLDFPSLRFLQLPDIPAAVLTDGETCIAYYEGVTCDIAPRSAQGSGDQFADHAAAYFQPACAAVHRLGRLALLAETTTSPRTTEGFFDDDHRPHARLYRWTR